MMNTYDNIQYEDFWTKYVYKKAKNTFELIKALLEFIILELK